MAWLLLALLLWPAVPSAQTPAADPEVVTRPEWAIGDWWEFMEKGNSYRLTLVAREKDAYVFVNTRPGVPGSDGARRTKIHTDATGAATKIVRPDGTLEDIEDKYEWVRFPLSPGKSWSFSRINVKSVKGGRSNYQFFCKARRWEPIEVGQRSVRALHVECNQRKTSEGNTAASMHGVWYAPEAKRVVRVTSDYDGGPAMTVTAWGSATSPTPPAVASTPASPPPQPPPATEAPRTPAPSLAPSEITPPAPSPPPRRVVELQGPPAAAIVIGSDRHTLDTNGKLTVQLPPGTHQLEATREGYLPLRQELRLAQTDKKTTVKLPMIAVVLPTIAVLDPKAGTLLRTPDVKLRIEVKSKYRLGSLVVKSIKPEAAPQTFTSSPTAKPGDTWKLEATVRLREGENTFTLTAVDEHGISADHPITLTRQLPPAPAPIAAAPPPAPTPAPISVTPTDTEPPRITINYPPPDTKVERDGIVLTGLVTDNIEVARVQIVVNGIEVAQPRDIAVVGRGQPIRVPVALQPGENLIEITAADKAGNVTQMVRAVTRAGPVVVAPAPPKIGNRWAVVIGVGEYEHRQIPKLRYAVSDAEAMYAFLTTQGGYPKDQVMLLTDNAPMKPTLVNIKRALGDFLARRAGRDDMVLIYFAGHGAPEVDVTGIENDGLAKYLVPRDGDPESLYTTALPMDEVQRIFNRIAAERVVMLLDTCYSGAAGGRTFARAQTRAGGLNDQFLERLTRSRGRVIITASGPNELALELPNLKHGLFTYYVLEGLRGKADRNRDGLVTVSELYEYVEEQVDRAARLAGGRQRPLMRGEIEGTLPLSTASRPR